MKKNIVVIVVVTLLILLVVSAIVYMTVKDNDATESPSQLTSESSTPASDTQTQDASSYVQTSETSGIPSTISEATVLVNELDDGEKGLLYLGLTKDDVISILENNKLDNFNMTEITNDKESWDWGNYVIDVLIYNNHFLFFFDKQDELLYRIDISGDAPLRLSTTQSGLKSGDTLETMVQLYGDDYTVYETKDSGKIYEYVLGDRYFQVCFLYDVVFRWGISEYTYDYNINIDNVHAEHYYDYLLVGTYIKSRIRAINNNNFDSIAEYLDENSDIYQSEKEYVEDCVLKGIQYELIDFDLEDLRQASENLYDIYCSIEFAEISPDNTKTEKTIYPKFTVFDNGNELKITTIAPLANDYVKIGEQAAKDCLAYLFGDSDVENITHTLGEPEKKIDTKYYHRWYFVQGIEIDVVFESSYDTTSDNNISFSTEPVMKNYIYLSDHCSLKTDRDIGIGSTYEEVMHAYQDEIYPELTNRDLISVGIGDINFVMKNDKVSSIYILSCSEMMSPEYYGEFKPDRP